ncbi:hypothetical protein Tco_1245957 [Tanacetum coccineum]
MLKIRKKIGELRKIKRLKIDIGRFSFALDDDEDYTIAITPVLSTEEPVDSLIMEDEPISGIFRQLKSDEVIKSRVVEIPSSNPKHIDYVDVSLIDVEIVSSEVVEIVIPEVGGIDTDILLSIKDDILREKLLNVNLLIANIEALKDNPTPFFRFCNQRFCSGSTTTRSDLFLPDYEAFYDHIEEKSSGSTTTHADFSQYDSFHFDLFDQSVFIPAV